MTKLGHPLELPQEYAADGYQVGGEARGGDFARIDYLIRIAVCFLMQRYE